jgi:hypothetical protein
MNASAFSTYTKWPLRSKTTNSESGIEGDLELAADAVAAIALHKIDEIEALKAHLDQRFADGRTSVLEAAT